MPRRRALLATAAGLVASGAWARRVLLPRRTAAVPTPVPRRPATGDPRPAVDGAGCFVVVNPSSGRGDEDVALLLRHQLPDAEVHELTEDDDVAELLRASSAPVLGVAGGDGTVGAAAGVAAATDRPLLVVPAGTLNHFARDLGLHGPADAVAAVRAGLVATIDLATAGPRPFVNTLALGGYPTLVDRREQLEARLGKWPALVVALAVELPRLQPCRVRVDGQERRLWLGWVGNAAYGPEGLAPAWRAALDDGLLDVRLVDGHRRWSRLRLLGAALVGRLDRCPAYERRLVPAVRFESPHGPFRVALDGETFDAPARLDVAKVPGGLQVVLPPT